MLKDFTVGVGKVEELSKGGGSGLLEHLGYIHVSNVCVSVLTGACSL